MQGSGKRVEREAMRPSLSHRPTRPPPKPRPRTRQASGNLSKLRGRVTEAHGPQDDGWPSTQGIWSSIDTSSPTVGGPPSTAGYTKVLGPIISRTFVAGLTLPPTWSCRGIGPCTATPSTSTRFASTGATAG